MRQTVIFAVALLAAGGYAAKIAAEKTSAPAAAKPQIMAATPQVDNSGRTVTIQRDNRGHYAIDGSVNGRGMNFMVDTGASVIAMRESDAAKVGIRPVPAAYTVSVSTANGNVKAARAEFDRVDIGGIRVTNVSGLVLPDNVLSENLLGLSFLSRLRRFEFASGKLVLEQ